MEASIYVRLFHYGNFLISDTYKCNILIFIHIHTTYSVLVTVNLTDAQTDAHIVRIDIRYVIHNLRV